MPREPLRLTPEVKLALYGDGPWMDEPDELLFEGAGLPCCALRNPEMGFWCGYVGLPRSHPLHGLHYDDPMVDVYVHGGVTFAGERAQLRAWRGGQDDGWWFGFDCGHSQDLIPGQNRWMAGVADSPDPGLRAIHAQLEELKASAPASMRRFFHDEYKRIQYVQRECHDLAKQLLAAAGLYPNSHTFCRGCKSYRALLLVDVKQGPTWLCGRCRTQLKEEERLRYRFEMREWAQKRIRRDMARNTLAGGADGTQ
jgi:hypothetical protein